MTRNEADVLKAKEVVNCEFCNGVGFFTEHDSPSSHSPNGECRTCPIQIECSNCYHGSYCIPEHEEKMINQIAEALSQARIDGGNEMLARVLKLADTFPIHTDHEDKDEWYGCIKCMEKPCEDFIKELNKLKSEAV